ncbi:MAG: AAA family ATPase [Phycisphaerales bacterium]|nr:AAA family ATPase [Phycisphaerales bacterium]
MPMDIDAAVGDGATAAAPAEATIRATLTSIRWQERGRVIAVARSDKAPRTLHVIGEMVDPTIGACYEFTGTLAFNDKYQTHEMRFVAYRTILPSDSDGIRRYLIDVAKWVGPTTATAIVAEFGANTLDVIRDQPHRLTHIPGLTAARVEELRSSLASNAAREAAMIEINSIIGGAMPPAIVRRAIKEWGSDAAHRIRENPFVLTQLHGVGFASADAVRRRLGIADSDLIRHAAAAVHVVREQAGMRGHTVLRQAAALAAVRQIVGEPHPEIFGDAMPMELVKCDGGDGGNGGDGGDSSNSGGSGNSSKVAEPLIALERLVVAEQYIASKIATQLHSAATEPWPIDTTGLGADQAEAVSRFADSAVFILCGAPGTGKTYTVARIVDSARRAGKTVLLCAPTGKAAKQMATALSGVVGDYGSGGGGATTIHSLLEPQVDEDTGAFTFMRGEHDPLQCDLLVVDEFSMVDVPLAASLLRALAPDSRLLIVGDHYQLSSVGPGAVLRDLLAAGVPSFELREIKRNAGRIVRACHAIKDGVYPRPSDRLDLSAGENWRHVEVAGTDGIVGVVEELIRNKLPAMGIEPTWQSQVITATNESGPLSCERLNGVVRALLNPVARDTPGVPFRVGDKVVRTKNGFAPSAFNGDGATKTPSGTVPAASSATKAAGSATPDEVRIVNGDLGTVEDVTARHVVVQLRYPDRRVVLPRGEHHLRQAYCLTCHKMQGSEVDVVILPLHRSSMSTPVVSREWVYTAFSRAKRFLVTVGVLDSIRGALRRVSTAMRETSLVSAFGGASCESGGVRAHLRPRPDRRAARDTRSRDPKTMGD